jgi:putative addiction module component (TIGR02574 family)
MDQLSVPERLKLISVLWDSIPESEAALPLPESHRRELEQRLEAARANPGAGVEWAELRDRLRASS